MFCGLSMMAMTMAFPTLSSIYGACATMNGHRLRPGDRVKLHLRPWPDVSAQYEKFNRTELDDSALQLEEPVWGEDIELLKR
jgi:hypothetical protein